MINVTTLFLHTLTPLHSGTGQTAAVIDLPIAREKTTGWPVIPASGFKGVRRNGQDSPEANLLYGSPDAAGELQFSDLHLLFFPARSLYGTFAYLTCPLALTRFLREHKALRPGTAEPFSLPTAPKDIKAILVGQGCKLVQNQQVILDDLDLTVQSGDIAPLSTYFATTLFSDTQEQQLFKERFAVVQDDLFTYLTKNACEVTARIALNSSVKTVENLWYEEAVPAEAIFHGPYGLAGRRENVVLPQLPSLIQLGGKESVGRGLCRLISTTGGV